MEANSKRYNKNGDLVDPNNKGQLDSSNCFTYLFLLFNFKVLRLGNKKIFSTEDFWDIYDYQLYGNNWVSLEKHLKKKPLKKHSLFHIMLSYIWKRWLLGVFFIFVSNGCVVTLPYFLKGSIDWVVEYQSNPGGPEIWKIIVYIVGLFLVLCLKGLFSQHGQKISADLVCVSINSVYGLVFEKLKTIDVKAMSGVNAGTLSNNITNDLFRIMISVYIAHNIFMAPIIIIIYLVILVFTIKYYALAGLGIVILVMFFQVFLSIVMARMNATKLGLNSLRNQEINFSMSGIKSVKFNAWEKVSKDIINKIRQKEKSLILKLQLLSALSKVITGSIPALSSFICIVLYNKYEENLNLGTVFFIITVFSSLASPMSYFFFGVMNLTQALVSLKRISRLLVLPDEPDCKKGQKYREEMDIGRVGDEDDFGELERGVVEFKDASFSYSTKEYEEKIKKIYEDFKLVNLENKKKNKKEAGKAEKKGILNYENWD